MSISPTIPESASSESSDSFSPFFGLLKGFFQSPKDVASIAPSSRFLIRHILRASNVEEAQTIVELGPGTGVVTRRMLENMTSDAKLYAVEIHEEFVEILRREYPDPRLETIHGSSTDLVDLIGESHADVVISGIPFSTMDPSISRATLEAVRETLKPGGIFVAYQFRDHVRDFAEPVFGKHISRVNELRNIPPMHVSVWRRDPNS